MKKLFKSLDALADLPAHYIPDWLLLLIMRISVFMIFWVSAQTKISGLTLPAISFGDFTLLSQQHLAFWSVTDSTIMLFEYEYDLPLIPPNIAAYLATISEFIFSLFILFGLLTRFSACAFLIMTAVIQIFVYPDAWALHLLWAAALIALIKGGPGKISIDHIWLRSA